MTEICWDNIGIPAFQISGLHEGKNFLPQGFEAVMPGSVAWRVFPRQLLLGARQLSAGQSNQSRR